MSIQQKECSHTTWCSSELKENYTPLQNWHVNGGGLGETGFRNIGGKALYAAKAHQIGYDHKVHCAGMRHGRLLQDGMNRQSVGFRRSADSAETTIHNVTVGMGKTGIKYLSNTRQRRLTEQCPVRRPLPSTQQGIHVPRS